MTYTVFYRNSSGNKDYSVIEAESRHALFVKLKEQKINPIRIVQGEEKHRLLQKNNTKRLSHKVIISLTVFALILLIVAILFRSRNVEIEKEPIALKTETGGEASKEELVTATNVAQTDVHTPTCSTNENLSITTVVQSASTTRLENASRLGTFYPNNKRNRPKKLFKHYSENYIAGLLRAKPGMTVVGTTLPPNFDDDFKKSLSEPIKIEKDDSPEDIEIKEMMKSIKESAKKIINDGGSIRETILEERKYLQKIAEMRHTLQKEVSRKRREGASEQELSETIESANQIMREYGGLEIKLSPFRYRGNNRE